jgi:hypothetical protein
MCRACRNLHRRAGWAVLQQTATAARQAERSGRHGEAAGTRQPAHDQRYIIIGLCREIKRLEKLLAQEAQGEKLRLYAQHARGERQPWPLLT